MPDAGRAAGGRGRPKKPLAGFGPVAKFATHLRQVRQTAGEPTYQRMASKSHQSVSSLSTADNGVELPSWSCVQEYLKACNIADAATLNHWKKCLDAATESAKVFGAMLDEVRTRSDLPAVLARLIERRRLDAGTVADRIAELKSGDHPRPDQLAHALCAIADVDDIVEVIAGRGDLDRDSLGYLIFASGGTGRDVELWQQAWDRVPRISPVPPLPDDMAEGAPTASPANPDEPASVAPPAGRRGARTATIGLAAAAMVAVLFTGGAFATGRLDLMPFGRNQGGRPVPIVPSPPSSTPSSPISAGDKIADLKRHLEQQPGTPATGRYTYVHIQVTSPNTSSPGAPGPVSDERLWWSPADLSGRRITTITPPGQPAGPPRIEDYAPDELPVVVRDPSVDPHTLRRQLAVQHPPALGAVAVLRSVADLYAYHLLTSAQHLAVLELLAQLDELTLQPMATDNTGRVGVAFSAHTSLGAEPGMNQRDTLIIDPMTGGLLSHETVALPTGQPHKARSLVQTVYLEYSRTDVIGR